jgi:glucose-1-phosphate adenylyltransferase
MELIDIIPVFNLYEEFWKIYTKTDSLPPQYIANTSRIERSILGEGCEIAGEVYNSVIGSGVTIEAGAVVRDSIIMQGTVIKAGADVTKSIIAENVTVGAGARLGVGEFAESQLDKKIYAFDLVTIGENSVIPDGVTVGKNVAISGVTDISDYTDGTLPSGGYIIKAGDK